MNQQSPYLTGIALRLGAREASLELGVREDDFTRGVLPNMRVAAEIQIGDRGARTVSSEESLGTLRLEARLQDSGGGSFKLWFEKAALDDSLSLFADDCGIDNARAVSEHMVRLTDTESELESVAQAMKTSPQAKYDRLLGKQSRLRKTREELRQQLSSIKKNQSDEELLADRIRRSLLPDKLLHRSVANRHFARETAGSDPSAKLMDGAISVQTELFRAATGEDRGKRRAFKEFSRRLVDLGLFADDSSAENDFVDLAPIHNSIFDEHQLLVSFKGVDDLPVENLGTGQQQAIQLLAQSHIADCPILQIEEPEAHLHKELMGRVARYLESSVSRAPTPLFDQLWLSTHHHQFAIAPTYLDVRLEDGQTVVQQKPRPMAAEHFYEPGPLWDALRELVQDGIPEDHIVFRDEQGNPVTARQILESVDGDRQLADKYLNSATKAVVMSFTRGNPE